MTDVRTCSVITDKEGLLDVLCVSSLCQTHEDLGFTTGEAMDANQSEPSMDLQHAYLFSIPWHYLGPAGQVVVPLESYLLFSWQTRHEFSGMCTILWRYNVASVVLSRLT